MIRETWKVVTVNDLVNIRYAYCKSTYCSLNAIAYSKTMKFCTLQYVTVL